VADGSDVTWSVAEGTKGRRWREVVVRDGGVAHSLLLETFPDRRFAHLELATPSGLLTLHPEPNGTLHGNAVTAAGIRHVLGWPFEPPALVAVEGSPVSLAAIAFAAGRPGWPDSFDLIVVRSDLRLERRIESTDGLAAVDDAGLPTLAEADVWPLELGDEAE
jgi:hypothetical protein